MKFEDISEFVDNDRFFTYLGYISKRAFVNNTSADAVKFDLWIEKSERLKQEGYNKDLEPNDENNLETHIEIGGDLEIPKLSLYSSSRAELLETKAMLVSLVHEFSDAIEKITEQGTEIECANPDWKVDELTSYRGFRVSK